MAKSLKTKQVERTLDDGNLEDKLPVEQSENPIDDTPEETVKIGTLSESPDSEVIEVDMPISEAVSKGLVKEHPVYIPEIPAQIIDTSVTEKPTGETEIKFLERLLHIQHSGGWGRHLDEIINDRIKSLQ